MNRNRRVRWIASVMGFLMLPLAGCNDLLEENPLGTLTNVNSYRTADDAVTALSGAYQTLHDYITHRDWPLMVETATPHIVSRLSPTHNRGCHDTYSCLATNSSFESTWEDMYRGINVANSVIDNVPGIAGMAPDLKARVVAEAKFLRAFHYFNLVRTFGGVPLTLNETSTLRDLNKPRAAVNDIYDAIIADLTEAEKNLPPTTRDFGRATRGAAQTLLGKAYLQRAVAAKHDPYGGDPLLWPSAEAGDLDNAISRLRAVVQSGVYGLVASYGDIWEEATKVNSETIWSVQNMGVAGQGMRIPEFLAPAGSGWGRAQWTTAQGELPFFQSYQQGDKRRDVSWVTEFIDVDGKRRVFDPDNILRDTYPGEGPAPSKYLHKARAPISGGNPRHFVVLRYADVLLMLAEALNERNNGPTAEAHSLVNQVRARAGLAPLPQGMSYAQFREALYWERSWELTQEQHAYFDRQRFPDLFGAHVAAHTQLTRKLPRFTVPQIAITMQDVKWLMAIPQDAIDRNRALTQNPGY